MPQVHGRLWAEGGARAITGEQLSARVGFVVGLLEAVGGEVGVDLGGDEIFVAEEFLHAAEVGTGIE